VRVKTRRSKFGNIRTKLDGYTFDSKMEARRYQELKLLHKAGEINGLEVHKVFSLDANGVHICNYEADFCYWVRRGHGIEYVVEDVKGKRTDMYLLKKKLMKALLGISILETRPR
jgi:hypothetical protein